MLSPSISVRFVLNFKSNSNLKWKQFLLTRQVHVLMANMLFKLLGCVRWCMYLSRVWCMRHDQNHPTRNDSPVIKLGIYTDRILPRHARFLNRVIPSDFQSWSLLLFTRSTQYEASWWWELRKSSHCSLWSRHWKNLTSWKCSLQTRQLSSDAYSKAD